MESLNEYRGAEWFEKIDDLVHQFFYVRTFVPVKKLNCPTSPLIWDWKSRAGKLSPQERLSDHCNYH